MKWLPVVSFLSLLSCRGTVVADLKSSQVLPGAPVQLDLINDGLEDTSWSPCSQEWFIEAEGTRGRDSKRSYCALSVSLPLGTTRLPLTAPDHPGRFFLILTIDVLSRASYPLEIGPIDVVP